jgi:hypothetical protein
MNEACEPPEKSFLLRTIDVVIDASIIDTGKLHVLTVKKKERFQGCRKACRQSCRLSFAQVLSSNWE